MNSRQYYYNIALACQKKVAIKFANGSSNRVEDRYDLAIKNIAILEQQAFKEKLDEMKEDAKIFAKFYQALAAVTSGNCQMQTYWAFAQYVMANVTGVTIVQLSDQINKAEHALIALGDATDPNSCIYHDPQNNEVFRGEEALGTNHSHAMHRFHLHGASAHAKSESWDKTKIREFLGMQPSESIARLEVPLPLLPLPPVKSKENWIKIQLEYQRQGTIAFNNKDWISAYQQYEKQITLLLNIYGEEHIELPMAYYCLGSAYFEAKRTNEAVYFLEQAHGLALKLAENASKKSTLFSQGIKDKLFSMMFKIAYKLGMIFKNTQPEEAETFLTACTGLAASYLKHSDPKMMAQAATFYSLAAKELEMLLLAKKTRGLSV